MVFSVVERLWNFMLVYSLRNNNFELCIVAVMGTIMLCLLMISQWSAAINYNATVIVSHGVYLGVNLHTCTQ